jgi:hypothetical protein
MKSISFGARHHFLSSQIDLGGLTNTPTNIPDYASSNGRLVQPDYFAAG